MDIHSSMAASTAFALSPSRFLLSLPTVKDHQPNSCSFRPTSNSRANSIFRTLRLRVSHTRDGASKRGYQVWADSGFLGGNSETYPESESHDSNTGVTVDLKLPRRRLLVEFTCSPCGERTKRLINPLAYERGTVFVQCAGCQQHHKLIDNLHLVVEYDLREEAGVDGDTDQV